MPDSVLKEIVARSYGPYTNFGFLVVWDRFEDVAVTAHVFRIEGETSEGDPMVREEEEFSVRVKWDGCSDLFFNPKCAYHACDGFGLMQIGETLKYIYEKADVLLGETGEIPDWPEAGFALTPPQPYPSNDEPS